MADRFADAEADQAEADQRPEERHEEEQDRSGRARGDAVGNGSRPPPAA